MLLHLRIAAPPAIDACFVCQGSSCGHYSAFYLAANCANADTLTGRVVSIADGDTITVLDFSDLDSSDKEHKVLSLLGIDAPESEQPSSSSPWSAEASLSSSLWRADYVASHGQTVAAQTK